MKRNQKGSSNIFVVAIIVILAVAGFYLLKGITTPSIYPNQQINTAQDMQSDNALQNASQDLDNTAVDGTFDPQLKQNDIDAQTF